MRKVYLDHNATTPLHPRVVEAMAPYFGEKFGNPSSVHGFGREARAAVDEAREKVAKLIGADAGEIVFTSGGTEADNFAIKGVIYANRDKGRHIITSSIEHHAVYSTCEFLKKEGFEITFLPVDEHGIVDADELKKAITKETVLITIMHANNEVGTIEPVEEIGKIAKERGIYFHTDAVQSVGKIPVDVKKLNVDLLPLSAHKIYGPKGIGALYIRKGTRMVSLLQGGHHERHRRAGTENVPGIVGLGKAGEIALEELKTEIPKILNLRNRLCSGIAERINHVRLNGHPAKRLPNTLNMSFEFVEGESLILSLDLKGIAVSTGSACTSGSLEPSHVLLAMGVPPEVAQGSLRFSLGRENNEEDIGYLLEVLPEIVDRLRAMSPLYKKGSEK